MTTDPDMISMNAKLDRIVGHVEYNGLLYKQIQHMIDDNTAWHRARRDDFKKTFDMLKLLTTKVDLLMADAGYHATGYVEREGHIDIIFSRAPSEDDES
jgi:hypothetical protein